MKNLKGAKVLDTSTQKTINGGWIYSPVDGTEGCPGNWCQNSFGRCTFCW